MIILDTSTLRSFALQSSQADLLRTIKVVGGERIGVPWMVMEELAAQQAIKYQELHGRAAQALDALRQSAPWDEVNVQLGNCNAERAREHWRSQWEDLASVIPTSDKALRQALFREANCLAPCRESKGQKIGARDAAIWLSAVEYAAAHPKETVYFVSANTKDFGDGSSYPYPMDEDVARLGDRFVLLTSMDDVTSRFTEPTEVDEALVTGILESEAVSSHISRAADAYLSSRRPRRVDCTVQVSDGSTFIASTLAWVTNRTHLGFVGEVQTYRIGDHEWCSAAVDWHLVGAVHTDPFGVVSAAVSWPTVVLFSLDRGTPRPTVLREGVPRPVSEDIAATLDLPVLDVTDVEQGLASVRESLRATLHELEPARSADSARRLRVATKRLPRSYEGALVRSTVLPDSALKMDREAPPGG
ncbi:PIN domain-containing protein [Streptomyces afghaniensis]|uniref:PIN domain-containing protein n=1 Tax=Streptomyces afghaniensis TaxID=66865 RepID=UPI00278876B5|nr:PIN domain-containing protein [Streptomyces afghaniensis]MDQ1018939.1 rRNA-processing protein FCF1 [Streptomyces afghaniensis]